jgi:dihydroorotase
MLSYDLIIKGGTLVSPSGQEHKDIAVKKGKIVKVADSIEGEASETIDAKGLHVFPGVIDSQVHFRDPGLTHKEDLATGSSSAALGGVTTFLEMPNTNPSTITDQDIAKKVAIGREKSVVNFGFFMGATADNLEELKKVDDLEGCCGIKIFLGSSTGKLLLYDDQKLLAIFKGIKSPIACHSENEERLNERLPVRDAATSAHQHPEWRDEETAFSSTQKLLELAKQAGRKVHVLHITSKKEMEFLASQKDNCTVEVTPQHLTLSAPDCYDRLGTYAQMNPPIRGEEHRKALWVGLKEGVVDVIGSDHAPHTKEEKDQPYPKSPSGMPGVQTLFPLMLNNVNKGELTLEYLSQLVCARPAEIYHLDQKGSLEEGKDADITLVDLKKKHVFQDEEQASRSGWTPFKGMEVEGMPVQTIVHGVTVMKDGKLTGQRAGQPINRR